MLYVKCVEITKIEINVCYSKNMLNSQIKGTQFVSLANFANNSYFFALKHPCRKARKMSST